MNRIPNRKFDSKSNRISQLRRSVVRDATRCVFYLLSDTGKKDVVEPRLFS